MSRHWYPHKLLNPDLERNIALIILNLSLKDSRDILEVLWKRASVKLCCDGGAGRLSQAMESERTRFTPDYITGDFDSVDKEVLEFYKKQGAEIKCTPDQNLTDFTKGVLELLKRTDKHNFEYMVALRAIGQRPDHTFANINTLFETSKFTEKPLYLMGNQSLSFLLQKGHHLLHVDQLKQGDWCALIPVGSRCDSITTTGLKWNLVNGQLEFGTLISTSNTVDGCGVVSVETSHPVLWMMKFP